MAELRQQYATNIETLIIGYLRRHPKATSMEVFEGIKHRVGAPDHEKSVGQRLRRMFIAGIVRRQAIPWGMRFVLNYCLTDADPTYGYCFETEPKPDAPARQSMFNQYRESSRIYQLDQLLRAVRTDIQSNHL